MGAGEYDNIGIASSVPTDRLSHGVTLSAYCKLPFAAGQQLFDRFQDPHEADKISKIERELDDVRETVVLAMNDVLRRGEKLEELEEKSKDVSSAAVQFISRCCSLVLLVVAMDIFGTCLGRRWSREGSRSRGGGESIFARSCGSSNPREKLQKYPLAQ